MSTVGLNNLSELDCVMVIGSEKGYVYTFDIMTDKKKKVTYDPQNEGGKVRAPTWHKQFSEAIKRSTRSSSCPART